MTPPSPAVRTVALLGNHAPRQCGIATFTTDLSEAIATEFPAADCFVLAMNDPGKGYSYPARVRCEIAEADPAAYKRAADFLNDHAVDVACVQHEYGIFGGEAGGHLLPLLRALRMPIVTTLHTILAEPTPAQRAVLDELARLSERLVVMSGHGAALLRGIYGVPAAKIDLIPHGIPIVHTDAGSKARLGLDGKSVILTFGLLSPDKGIEHVIGALPSILVRHPEAVYVVLGATHPRVLAREGEAYRMRLEKHARQSGVAAQVIFHNRFVSRDELTGFLAAADIYITPYLKPEQITSGTLAYAVGSGRAAISTPYWYARELLADGRGVLVPWRDPGAIACEVTALLDDDVKRLALCERAAALGRDMLWPSVARRYMESFAQAHAAHAERTRAAAPRSAAPLPAALPALDLGHLREMTDGTGVFQHAAFNVPRYDDGYSLDDNARALLLTALIEQSGADAREAVRPLASRYLAFVRHAFDGRNGRFRNFMSFPRRWLEAAGSDDSNGRAVWALGTVVGRSADAGRRGLGDQLFRAALPTVTTMGSPRAWAYALLGIAEYVRAFAGVGEVEAARATLAERLLGLFRRTARHDWPWFEDCVTYCNARLSQALIVSGPAMAHEEMTAAGLRSLAWLAGVQSSPDGQFAPVGSDGFYTRGRPKAAFDQQPVEACAMVSACLAARRATGDERWAIEARRAFDWFLGHNQLQRPLYDPSTGGCRDGLHADRANENQGAESTLSFLLALSELRAA